MIEKIKILIVDDHPVLRRGIRSLLSNSDDFDVVDEAADLETAKACLMEHKPDVVLLDIRLPGESGLDLLTYIQTYELQTRALILTSFDDDEHVLQALQRGAHGYILKNVSDEMLCDAIRAVYRNGRVLSPQVTEQLLQQLTLEPDDHTDVSPNFTEEERQLLALLVKGASNDDIAAELFISIATVKRKLRKIFDKLKVQNRAQAAAEAVQRGIV